MSTNSVRDILENMGAVRPGLRAVALVAHEVSGTGCAKGAPKRWILKVPRKNIERAVQVCRELDEDSSYPAFAQALQQP